MLVSRYTQDRPRVVGDDDGEPPVHVVALGVGFGFRKGQTGWVTGTLVRLALYQKLFARLEPAEPAMYDLAPAFGVDDDVDPGEAPRSAVKPRGRRPARPVEA